MASKISNWLRAFLCTTLIVGALSIAGCGGGGSEAETVQGEAGGTPATGAGGTPAYREDPANKAAGGSGMPMPSTK